jgi:hypothetical protein
MTQNAIVQLPYHSPEGAGLRMRTVKCSYNGSFSDLHRAKHISENCPFNTAVVCVNEHFVLYYGINLL